MKSYLSKAHPYSTRHRGGEKNTISDDDSDSGKDHRIEGVKLLYIKKSINSYCWNNHCTHIGKLGSKYGTEKCLKCKHYREEGDMFEPKESQ